MILRVAKLAVILAVALFYTFVVFNNLTDYDSNYQFVRHVLMMDSTFPGNRGMWRAMNSPVWHTAFYLSIIAWESVVMVLCWWGGVRLARVFSAPAEVFNRKRQRNYMVDERRDW
jgi:predicted small integral membrane protein